MTDALGRFSRDMAAAGNDLDDLDEPRRDVADEVQQAIQGTVPVVSGFLRSSVFVDDAGVALGAVYAAYVETRSPYVDQALDRVDIAKPFEEYADRVIGHHLSTFYF